MQHSQNMHEIAPHRIKQTIRKSGKESAANIWNYLGIKQGCLLKPL